jgi:PAP_fibrillin
VLFGATVNGEGGQVQAAVVTADGEDAAGGGAEETPAEEEKVLLLADAADADARRDGLKLEMLQLGASYDRGFAATSRSREEARRVISKLEALNPEGNAALGIDGNRGGGYDGAEGGGSTATTTSSPLAGNWRMVWTTAPDVLILGANPLVTVGAIYQLFTPPVVTNVIDFLPRFHNLFQAAAAPSSSSSSSSLSVDTLVRAEVRTRASPRPGRPMRVGLVFESVRLEPIEVFGSSAVAGFLPPLAFDLPRLPSLLVGEPTKDSDAVGYFDVTYLDSELLILRQNAPGGLFVLTRVENSDP